MILMNANASFINIPNTESAIDGLHTNDPRFCIHHEKQCQRLKLYG